MLAASVHCGDERIVFGSVPGHSVWNPHKPGELRTYEHKMNSATRTPPTAEYTFPTSKELVLDLRTKPVNVNIRIFEKPTSTANC